MNCTEARVKPRRKPERSPNGQQRVQHYTPIEVRSVPKRIASERTARSIFIGAVDGKAAPVPAKGKASKGGSCTTQRFRLLPGL